MFHRRKTPKAPVPKPPVDATANMTPEEKEEAAKKAKALRMYFNAGTQAAIVAYQASDDRKEREQLYVQSIMPAFEKLVENLINIHRFTALHDTFEELKNDCVNFLFETIRKFDGNRGTNAFSYFNVVAKNWLIIRTKQKTLRMKRAVSLDDPDSLSQNEQRMIMEHDIVANEDLLAQDRDTNETLKILYDIRTKTKTENELTCVNSIITIFENIDDIDLLNKSAVLMYMRELSGLSPKQLTTALQVVKRLYKKNRADAAREE